MSLSKTVGKREFIQHTSKYLNWVEKSHELIITHHGEPDLRVLKVKAKSVRSLRGCADIKIHGDINEPVLPDYEKW